jgi:large subunit ribosomal protein L29
MAAKDFMLELRNMEVGELQARLEETRRELFNLRQQWYMGGLEDHNRMRAVRKDIARILTVLREREMMAEHLAEGEGA